MPPRRGYPSTMTTPENDREPDEEEAPVLDRGLAPPSVEPEITSTQPLDKGLAPPDDENGEGNGE